MNIPKTENQLDPSKILSYCNNRNKVKSEKLFQTDHGVFWYFPFITAVDNPLKVQHENSLPQPLLFPLPQSPGNSFLGALTSFSLDEKVPHCQCHRENTQTWGKKKKKEKGSWEEWCLAATIVLVTLAPAGLSCLGNRWYHNHNYLVSQPTRGLWSQNKWRDFSS